MDPSEIQAFELLFSVILTKEMLKFTSLVRTKFQPFLDQLQCEADREALMSQGEKARWIIENVRSVLWLDNDLETEATDLSRARMLEHLKACNGVYHPTELDMINRHVLGELDSRNSLSKEIQVLTSLNLEQHQLLAELEEANDQNLGQRFALLRGQIENRRKRVL